MGHLKLSRHESFREIRVQRIIGVVLGSELRVRELWRLLVEEGAGLLRWELGMEHRLRRVVRIVDLVRLEAFRRRRHQPLGQTSLVLEVEVAAVAGLAASTTSRLPLPCERGVATLTV